MAFPTMRVIQSNNHKKKLESYGEAAVSAAKLYVDSYSNDLFDPSFKNDFKLIELSEIKKKGLLKDVNLSDLKCINGESNITVVKYNNDYAYCLNLICTDKKNNEVYKTYNKKGSCAKFTKVNVTYKYGDYTKNYLVIDGDDWAGEGLRDHHYEAGATLYMNKNNSNATNYWCVNDYQNCTVKIDEDKTFVVAKYLAKDAGMLDDLKRGNITIELYAGWE